MDCERTQELLHGYFDGELDLVRSLEIEHHMDGCPSCTAAHQSLVAVRDRIRSSGEYFRAPASLDRRIRTALKQADGEAAGQRPSRPASRWTQWLALAATVAVAFVAVWQFVPGLARRPDRSLESEILSGHVRSLMPGHLTDVTSEDGHTVKPWFAGRLDFSPRVVDLTNSGFPLIGGRLDYIGGRRVAALVYRRRQHIINLFVWPSAGEGAGASARQGYNSVRWFRAGMEYWAISDLNEAELKQFAQLADGS